MYFYVVFPSLGKTKLWMSLGQGIWSISFFELQSPVCSLYLVLCTSTDNQVHRWWSQALRTKCISFICPHRPIIPSSKITPNPVNSLLSTQRKQKEANKQTSSTPETEVCVLDVSWLFRQSSWEQMVRSIWTGILVGFVRCCDPSA